tara:strand:- start:201 stop:317 length:117 start_codon:yes stop_codon:yes gene_type:complete
MMDGYGFPKKNLFKIESDNISDAKSAKSQSVQMAAQTI